MASSCARQGNPNTGGQTRNLRDTISTMHQPDNFCPRDTGDVHSSGNHHLWRAGHPRCPSCCTATADCLVLSEPQLSKQPCMRKPPLFQESPGHQGEQMTSGVDAAIANSLHTRWDTPEETPSTLLCWHAHHMALGVGHTPPSLPAGWETIQAAALAILSSQCPSSQASEAFQTNAPPSSYTTPCSNWFRVGHQGSVITEEGAEAQHCHVTQKSVEDETEKPSPQMLLL